MKLSELLGNGCFGTYTFNGQVWPEVAGKVAALRAVGSIPADIFFAIVRTRDFGIARKLRALATLTRDAQGYAPTFSSVHHFAGTDKTGTIVPAPYQLAVIGIHGNISARATERNLCSAWMRGRKLAKISEVSIELALERADARRMLSSGLAKPTAELYCKAW